VSLYWPPSSKVEIADFGGGTNIVLCDVFLASFFSNRQGLRQVTIMY